jgi:hypothetical protein
MTSGRSDPYIPATRPSHLLDDPTVTSPEKAMPFDNWKGENPRVADEMQPKRRATTLASSRLNDLQRSNAGARMLLAVHTNRIMSGGLHLVAKKSI